MEYVFFIGVFVISFAAVIACAFSKPEMVLIGLMGLMVWVLFTGLVIHWKTEDRLTNINVIKTEFGYVANTPNGVIKEDRYSVVNSTEATNMVVVERVVKNLQSESTYRIERK